MSLVLEAARQGSLPMLKYLAKDLPATSRVLNKAVRIAAKEGHLNIAKWLVEEHGVCAKKRHKAEMSVLHIAAEMGRVDVLKWWLCKHPEAVDSTCDESLTALILAARHGHRAAVQCLLDAGADVDKTEEDLDSPLLAATKGGHIDVVQLLVDAEADVDYADHEPETALSMACGIGLLDVVKCLVQAGADVDKAGSGGQTPLGSAAAIGRLDMVKYLVGAGANVDKASERGYTPLHYAARNGHCEILKYLATECHADLSKLAHNKSTLIHTAARGGQLEALQWLVRESGIDINKVDCRGESPLWYAWHAWHGGRIRVIRWMVTEGGVDVDQIDTSGLTLLHRASRGRYCSDAQCLVDLGADLEKRTPERDTPLLLAVRRGKLDIVKCLMQAGADINSTGEFGDGVLRAAVRNKQHAVMEWLVDEAGVEVTWTDLASVSIEWQERAARFLRHRFLTAACRKGDIHVVSEFFFQVSEEECQTALKAATEAGRHNVVCFLLSAHDCVVGAEELEAAADHPAILRVLSERKLVQACREGDAEEVQALAARGVSLDCVDPRSAHTPLLAALQAGHGALACWLLKAGADIAAFSEHNPVDMAVRAGHDELACLLVRRGAAPGETVGEAAAKGMTSYLELVIEHRAKRRLEDAAGATPVKRRKTLLGEAAEMMVSLARPSADQSPLCVVCMVEKRTHALNCAHFCLCADCQAILFAREDRPRCPICRARVSSATRIFL